MEHDHSVQLFLPGPWRFLLGPCPRGPHPGDGAVDSVNLNKHAKYLGQRSLILVQNLMSVHNDTHRGLIARPGPRYAYSSIIGLLNVQISAGTLQLVLSVTTRSTTWHEHTHIMYTACLTWTSSSGREPVTLCIRLGQCSVAYITARCLLASYVRLHRTPK